MRLWFQCGVTQVIKPRPKPLKGGGGDRQWGAIYQLFGLLGLAFLLGSCGNVPPVITPPALVTPNTAVTIEPPPVTPTSTIPPEILQATVASFTAVQFGFTYAQADGNRYLAEGHGRVPLTIPTDIPLRGQPIWIVAVPYQTGILWVVALENGDVQAIHMLSPFTAGELRYIPNWSTPGKPLAVRSSQDGFALGNADRIAPTTFTHDTPLLDGSGRTAYIDDQGWLGLVAPNGQLEAAVPVQALPDTRLLTPTDGTDNRLLLLSEPTERYNHAVLGDQLEAASITLLQTTPVLTIVQRIEIPAPEVVEGLFPLWADLTGDGKREIIVVLSEATAGARLAIFSEDGSLLTSSPPIGQGYRWRNPAAVAPFAPDGALELAEVRTPHLDGVVQFWQWQAGRLVQTAALSGYTSHRLGSRNLDMVLAGDFDGQGQVQLLLPTLDLTELAAVQRVAGGVGAVEAWRVPLDGTLQTNLAAALTPDGMLAVAVGTDQNLLRIWWPEEWPEPEE